MIRAILFKDWMHYWKAVLLVTMMLLVPHIFVDLIRADLQRAFNVGILVAAAYTYSQFTFENEYRHDTLPILRERPIHPVALLLVKYISLYSMIIFTMTVPIVFSGDWKQCIIGNGFGILLGTLFITSSIIWNGLIGPKLILFIMILTTFPMNYPGVREWLTSHLLILALISLAVTPVIALASTVEFARKLN